MEFLFGTIREIMGMPENTAAAIALDTDDDHALCVKVFKDHTKKEVIVGCHFMIDWLEKDTEKVDWLARFLAYNLQRAFLSGVASTKKEISEQLKGFKELLKA